MFALAPGYGDKSGSARTAWTAVFSVYQDKQNPKQSRAGGGLYRTDDGGVTWHTTASPGMFDGGAMSVAAAPNGRLFAGYVGGTTGNAGLVCSTDGGNTWQASCPKVGDAANDPGPVPNQRIQSCPACAAKPSASATPQGDAAANAMGQGAGGSSSGGGGAATGAATAGDASPSTTASRGAGRTALWIMAAVLAGVLGVGTTVAALRKRRRTTQQMDAG
jgi:hypothetical protein